MKIKTIPFITILLFIVVFTVFFQGLKNTNIYVPNNDLEKTIPSFTTKLLNSNKEINSNEIFKNNKYYLMNIWSSWCVPCKDEHQFLMELNKEKNLEIIGLNYKDNILNAKKFLAELKNPYSNIISDLNGLIAIEWGAYGVPESFFDF